MKLVLHIAFLPWPVGSLVNCRNLNKTMFLSLDTEDDCFKTVSVMRWMSHVLHVSWPQGSTKYKLICNGVEGWKVLVNQWSPITRIPWFDFCLAVVHNCLSNLSFSCFFLEKLLSLLVDFTMDSSIYLRALCLSALCSLVHNCQKVTLQCFLVVYFENSSTDSL